MHWNFAAVWACLGVALLVVSIPGPGHGLAATDSTRPQGQLLAAVAGPGIPVASSRGDPALPNTTQGLAEESAAGSPAWANLSSPATGPTPPVLGASIAYDPADGYDILFGGFIAINSTYGYSGATWAFDDAQWVQLHPTTSPPARYLSVVAWDPVDGYLVVFGGYGYLPGNICCTYLSDTWEFSNGNWTQLEPANHPSARDYSSLTWDAADGCLLLFGGDYDSGVGLNDTWTFVRGQWTELYPTVVPLGRLGAALAFDAVDNYTVLFGGYGPYGAWGAEVGLDDTWTFSAGNWTPLYPREHPPVDDQEGACWDPAEGFVFVLGASQANDSTGASWAFVGGQWAVVEASGSPPIGPYAALTYDPVQLGLVLVTGNGSGGTFAQYTWLLYHLNLTAQALPASGIVPLTVAFSANASGAHGSVSPVWTFGDGNQTSVLDASETYVVPGVFNASVRVTDRDGSSANVTFRVVVTDGLTATALISTVNGTPPLTVDCAALPVNGTPPYSYEWESGAGQTSSEPTADFVYDEAGTYNLSLSITDRFGTVASHSFLVSVSPLVVAPLVAVLRTSGTLGVAPLTVNFSATEGGGEAPYTVTWAFGDGNVSEEPFVTHTFTSAGLYTTTLTVSDSQGRQSTESVLISVAPPLWLTAAVSPTQAPVGVPVTFNASFGGGIGPDMILWEFGDGANSTLGNTTHAYATGGTYNVAVIVTDRFGDLKTEEWTVGVPSNSKGANPLPAGPTNWLGAFGPPEIGFLLIGLVAGVVATAVAVRLLRPRPTSTGDRPTSGPPSAR